MKVSKIIKYLFVFLLIIFICLFIFSTNWALETFAFINFDEIIFQLTTPIENAGGDVLVNYFSMAFVPALKISFLVFVIYLIIDRFLACDVLKFEMQFWNKTKVFNIKTKIVRLISYFIVTAFCLLTIYNCLSKINFFDYLIVQIDPSTFIEDNYVDAKEVKITAPDKKRNLIFIFAESLESTFFSSKYGGGDENNYLSPLVDLTKDNIHFSNSDKFGGALYLSNTSWTSASMVGATSGIPLKTRSDAFTSSTCLISNVYNLGDILQDNGYNQMLMIGSDGNFGNRNCYFNEHGYDVFDYNSAIKMRKIDKNYNVWWGYEDSKLFSYAKEELVSLSSEDKPFNLTLLTTGTHTVDGYVEEDCDGSFSTNYGNAIYCSSKQILEFVNWVKEQEFYQDTTIIIIGDHLSMQPDFYPKETNRTIYDLFINSAIQNGSFKNRGFTTLDIFPTTLASLGFEIDGDRLGLGTNLFSDRETLAEEYGAEEFNNELCKISNFYNNRFLLNK